MQISPKAAALFHATSHLDLWMEATVAALMSTTTITTAITQPKTTTPLQL
jgi:hypothetical protein